MKINPGRFGSGYELRTERVRTCIAVVIEAGDSLRYLLHYNGVQGVLNSFLSGMPSDSVAKIAGGSLITPDSGKNLADVLQALERASIPVVSSDVGGFYQRSVISNQKGTKCIREPLDFFGRHFGMGGCTGYESDCVTDVINL